jgi:predicted lysophospholipase L1 biosynthesis ABC-type transport system permease subunit
MSTVAALPFFLLTLPAGALADMVDRKKLLLIMNLWLAGSTGFLAFLGFFGLLNPYEILVSVFMMGVGFAFNCACVELGGSRGCQQRGIGFRRYAWRFAAQCLRNHRTCYGCSCTKSFRRASFSVCFLIVTVAIARWKSDSKQTRSPLENFFESLTGAIRYVRYAPGIQVDLARNVLFALFISVIPALLPVGCP